MNQPTPSVMAAVMAVSIHTGTDCAGISRLHAPNSCIHFGLSGALLSLGAVPIAV